MSLHRPRRTNAALIGGSTALVVSCSAEGLVVLGTRASYRIVAPQGMGEPVPTVGAWHRLSV